MPDYSPVVQHLIDNALPAAAEYYLAEQALTAAFDMNPSAPTVLAEARRTAVRKASEVAIAIDGLTDRMNTASGTNLD